MNKFIIRWVINAIALYAAIMLVPGIEFTGGQTNRWVSIILLALVFGLLNALLRPLLILLTCPLIILTLGLGTLLINTFLFYLTGLIGNQFGWGFTVDNFFQAFLGALIVSIVSFVLNILLRDDMDRQRKSYT
jgi:putative membrane protein